MTTFLIQKPLIEFKSNLNSFYDKSNQLKPIEILKLIKYLKQYAWKKRQRITQNSYRHKGNKFGRTLGFILFSYTFRTKSLFPTNWLVSVTWIVLNLDFIPTFWKMLFKRKPTLVCKNGVIKHFLKFKGKHLCHSLFFNKVAGLKPATLLKKRLVQVISWNICEIFKNSPGGCKTINLRVSLLYKQLHDFRYPYVWAVASFWHHLVLNPLVCGVH